MKAIRHGVRMDGTPLLFMPSTEFHYLSDRDLGAVIAYIQTAPPMNNVLPPSSVSPIGRLVMMVPGITFIPAELIPHDAAAPGRPAGGDHGGVWRVFDPILQGLSRFDDVRRGRSGLPCQLAPRPQPDLGEGSALPSWTEDDFINTMRTGKRPVTSSSARIICPGPRTGT
ncbi:MAG: hypothetical protein MZV64_59345 [Ignavibacteriales bacterium]|nr:hypothetical protein [Ignavibacteriales bacterium]